MNVESWVLRDPTIGLNEEMPAPGSGRTPEPMFIWEQRPVRFGVTIKRWTELNFL